MPEKKTKGMNDKERFDSLHALWKGAWENFHERRRYEWKFSFGIWTALVLIAGQIALVEIKNQPTPLSRALLILLSVIILVGILLTHVWWLVAVRQAHKTDRNIADCYENEMLKITNGELLEKLADVVKKDKVGWWGTVVPIIITVLLTLLVVVVLILKGDGII